MQVVTLKNSYVRDAQMYVGPGPDVCTDEEFEEAYMDEDNWRDCFPNLVLDVVDEGMTKTEIVKSYNEKYGTKISEDMIEVHEEGSL